MSSKSSSAIILVGGYGTRLRPLTLTRPKPLIPFVNIPIISHQIKKLHEFGTRKIILAANYRTEDIVCQMTKLANDLGIEIIFSVEKEVLGTGGPLALARQYLDEPTPVFVLNSDVICEYPFDELFAAHLACKRKATILTTVVDDPSRYGVILKEGNGITRFVEKPKNYVGNTINAGIYVMNREVLNDIPLKEVSLENEVFAQMAVRNELAAFELKGFWKDIGQHRDYLVAQHLFLSSKGLESVIDETAVVRKEAFIGENVVIGKNVKIGMGAYIKNATLMDNTVVSDYCVVLNSIIGFSCKISKWCRLEKMCVLADEVEIKECISLRNCIVLPNKRVSECHDENILM
ncbi:hypothetical protein VCUG_01654 [Vavraia culicis subsp. floridensis]|uniref:mannose-1-phosphate guanylyltransferase n=1 Tax=Vavraia culicis (isolate floridensis) TaxID=948595 RepID=L2GUX6_VAVCU|nr:uncharacterized protein VCUG_01654 [Vavraia culicis subsp. floridensis]ELA46880.1 hypothetical protein VCUG_01654 [Vavraia culicis subsp. floridensis]